MSSAPAGATGTTTTQPTTSAAPENPLPDELQGTWRLAGSTSTDPVRLYLREMGVVPLLTREGEVAIAKRIERGQIKTQKAIAR